MSTACVSDSTVFIKCRRQKSDCASLGAHSVVSLLYITDSESNVLADAVLVVVAQALS